MRSTPVRVGLAAVVALVTLHSAVETAASQSWRTAALAAFDDAWQTINDTYYDPAFGGLDWPAVRDELRPRAASAADPDDVRAIIREMLGRLGESHFALLSAASGAGATTGDAVIPMQIRPFDAGILVTGVEAGSTAAEAGIKPGDRLVAIDGKSVRELPTEVDVANDARTRDLALWRQATAMLRGPLNSRVHLALESPDGRARLVDVARVREDGDAVSFGYLPSLRVRTRDERLTTPMGREVGLVAFNVWMPAVAAPFDAAIDRFRSADGLIIDLRGNFGGLADMMRGVAGHVLNEPAVIGRMKMRDVTLEFRANPRRSTADGRRVEPFAGPVAVLIDELTGSTSECFAGGLQGLGRVRVFGTRSMGQALPAALHPLPNGDVLQHVVGDFITASGVRLEHAGVVPDEVVDLDPVALAAGRDVVVDAALRWLDRSARSEALREANHEGRSLTDLALAFDRPAVPFDR